MLLAQEKVTFAVVLTASVTKRILFLLPLRMLRKGDRLSLSVHFFAVRNVSLDDIWIIFKEK